MKLVVLIFFASLLLGTVSGISLTPSVTLYMHDVMLMLLFFASLIALFLRKTCVRPRLLLPISGFVLAGIISLVLNTFRFPIWETGQSSLYLFRWIAYAGVYVVVAQSLVSSAFWLWGLFGAGAGFAALGLLQYVLYPSLRNLMYLGWDPHDYRLFSTLLDPNFMGIILVLTVFLCLNFIRRPLAGDALQGDALRRVGLWFGLGILLIALLLTHSRSSYLALVAGAFYLLFQSKQWRAKGIIAILFFLFIIVVTPKPGGDTLRLDRMVTTIARVENWQQSIIRIGESPIFGFGFNTLRFTNPGVSGIDMTSKAAAGVDNSFLFILLTTGGIGFIAYGWLMVRQIRLIREPIFLASFIAILVHSIFMNTLFYPWVMIWMWVLTGVVEIVERDPSTLPRQARDSLRMTLL